MVEYKDVYDKVKTIDRSKIEEAFPYIRNKTWDADLEKAHNRYDTYIGVLWQLMVSKAHSNRPQCIVFYLEGLSKDGTYNCKWHIKKQYVPSISKLLY